MLVRFTSNAVNSFDGFTATETSFARPCSGAQTITVSDTPFSDGAGNYLPSTNCSWSITAPADSAVTLTFSSFALEDGVDFFVVYDVSGGTPFLIANYTGFVLPPATLSLGPAVLVVFTTSVVNQFAGFDAVATFSPVPACSGNVTITTPGTVIGDGTGNYAINAVCYWLATAPPGFLVNLQFLTFTTEASSDLVNIYDGTSTAAPLLGSRSGSTVPVPSRSTQQNMLVRFTSNAVNNFAGFSAVITFVPYQCNGTSVINSNGVQFTTSNGVYLNSVVW